MNEMITAGASGVAAAIASAFCLSIAILPLASGIEGPAKVVSFEFDSQTAINEVLAPSFRSHFDTTPITNKCGDDSVLNPIANATGPLFVGKCVDIGHHSSPRFAMLEQNPQLSVFKDTGGRG